ncbi:M61 family metallopeptidase [Picosynechococcus sp. PCC 11901]|uniref:M61 family metallopeptidase n=1 Tax=Picosynechococcus sp. PCC 11901 TaxID=2579791 RepID=UPI0010FC186A|nr:M61 family metallopeptidase [Picosynechococcus sp. PCC 11901]QCS50399.1 M61 family metallopeptidase [Picosynechococcus sp. PCC 11901]
MVHTATSMATPAPSAQNTVAIAYQVAMPQPQTHLFEVTIHISQWEAAVLDLKMPVWTPGSYMVREYSRHLQDFRATTAAGVDLSWRKVTKNHWQVETTDTSDIQVHYRVFANDLTVRTNHLDGTHGYFNGAALFCFIPGYQDQACTLTVEPPHIAWEVNTTLPLIEDQENCFWVENFDVLVDSPVEVGLHENYEFLCAGKPHRWVVWGEGNFEAEKAIADTKKIIQTEAKIFGGELPYDEYMFLLHLSGSGYGGLEHKESCSLNYPRFGFQKSDQYNRFMQLVAHEFFHLWNVKRIRPKELETFDYETENYTPSLWFAEGVTSYYDLLIPLWAGIYDKAFFLESLSKDITRYLLTPGRLVQPLAESSFDAWIKLYRREAHSNNNQMSYYLKGALVAMLLDLKIRDRHQNQKSLDDVLRIMWEKFGKPEIGFSPAQVEQVISEVAGFDLSDFFHEFLHTTAELPLGAALETFGLQIKPIYTNKDLPYLGLTVTDQNNRTLVQTVNVDSPAYQAGIDPEDELLAIANYRTNAEQLNHRLQNYQAGDTISITIFHQDQLKTLAVTLAAPQPSSYQVVKNPQASAKQLQNLKGWLNPKDSGAVR